MDTKNFDSEFCGKLPIHHINTIQSHGAVLVLDKETSKIIQTSTNIIDYLQISAEDILQRALYELTGESESELKALMADCIKRNITSIIHIDNVSFSILVSEQPNYIVIDLQPTSNSVTKGFGAFNQIKQLIDTLDTASDLHAVCNLVVREIRKMIAIDGVMMYKFDADWNGTVLAEDKCETLEPYLGVTFPASDVPRQARELYLKNPIRLISRRDYVPSRLYPVINPRTNVFTDLSGSFLRGVSDVHLEYLNNMGVMGSMSMRVIHNGRLWGLITCNHCSPIELSFEDCTHLSLLSNVISGKISAIINASEYQFIADLQKSRNTLVDQVRVNGLHKGLFDGKVNILDLFSACGAVIYLDGRYQTCGSVADSNFLDNLYLWLQAKDIHQIYRSHNLVSVFEEAAAFGDVASGMLAIPISRSKSDFIVCFRPEVIKTIEWGGNPHQAITFEDGSEKYHPRNSFKIWMETVNQTASPWHEQELQIADSLRSYFIEQGY